MKRAPHTGRSAFTLIEVSFALMVMAVGLMAVFHLFPTGLRASIDANAFSRQAQFAGDVMESLRIKAAQDWPTFVDLTEIELADGTMIEINAPWSEPIVYPDTTAQSQDEYIRYKIELSAMQVMASSDSHMRQVIVETRYGRSGNLGKRFYTEIYRVGMP